MSQELTVGKHSITEIIKLGEMLAKSGFFKDSTDPAKAVAKIMAGQELGIPPFAAMANIYIIEGKPVLSANLIAGMIKRSPKYDYRVEILTDHECHVEFYANGKPLGEAYFSMDDAKRAGLSGKDNWRKYPRNMLFSRCLSDGGKRYCPDIFITGIYVDGADFDAVAPVEEIDPKFVDIPAEPVANKQPAHERPDELVMILDETKALKELIAKEMGNEIDAKVMWPQLYETLQNELKHGRVTGEWDGAIEFAEAIRSEYHAISEGHLPGVEDVASEELFPVEQMDYTMEDKT